MTTSDPRYRIEQQLGTGAASVVFLAEEVDTGRKLALKVLREMPDAAMRARFEAEAALLSKLTHPGIVGLVAHGQLESGGFFIAMPYIGGARTLADWITTDRPGLKPAELRRKALGLLGDLGGALDHIHTHGVLHRDLKPSNVLVTADGRAVVLDFGLALIAGRRLTATGFFVGTPAYMSPEQARGDTLGPPSDLYQLGMIAHEIVTGREAVTDIDQYLDRLSRGVLPFPPARSGQPELGEDLERSLLRATAVNPRERFPSASAFVAELEALPAGSWGAVERSPSTVTAVTPPVVPRVASPAVSRPTPATPVAAPRAPPPAAAPAPAARALRRMLPAIGLAALATVAVLWLAPAGRREPEPPRILVGHDRALVELATERPTSWRLVSRHGASQERGAPTTPDTAHRFLLGPFDGAAIEFELASSDARFAGRIEPPLPIRLVSCGARTTQQGLGLHVATTGPVAGALFVERASATRKITLAEPRTRHDVALTGWPARGSVSVTFALTDALGRPIDLPACVVRLGR